MRRVRVSAVFLHVGGDAAIRCRQIIAVLDARGRRRQHLLPLLQGAAARGRLVDLSEGRPKSVLVTEGGVYVLALSAAALRRRLEERRAPWGEL